MSASKIQEETKVQTAEWNATENKQFCIKTVVCITNYSINNSYLSISEDVLVISIDLKGFEFCYFALNCSTLVRFEKTLLNMSTTHSTIRELVQLY